MEAQKHTRRVFLRMSAFTAAGVALAACTKPAATAVPAAPTAAAATKAPEAEAPAEEVTEEAEATEEVAAPAKYSESPMMAALVAEGKLPPVEERLPEEPLVVTPLEKVGKYAAPSGGHPVHRFLQRRHVVGGRQPTTNCWHHPICRAASPNIIKDWRFGGFQGHLTATCARA
jgi:glucose/arabinose dehydrogenase